MIKLPFLKFRLIAVICLFYFAGCSSTEETIKGLPYDPKGSTVTTDKEITPHHIRTFLFSGSRLYVSNEFTGSRLNDFYKKNDSLFIAVIKPENEPINNSAWYAFKIWSPIEQTVNIKLTYEDGSHRYYPKLSYDKVGWTPIDSANYFHDTSNGTALLTLKVNEDTLWISGQEILTSNTYEKWMQKLAEKKSVSIETIGYSEQGKPLKKIIIGNKDRKSGYVYFIGRLHPPEIPGAVAMEEFVKTFAEDSKLANNFREMFTAYAVPLVNPDGVDNGHWRHNIDGVDLNRDWVYFNQQEPGVIRNDMMSIADSSEGKLKYFIDFHSTQVDVFYINAEDKTAGLDSNYQKIKLWFAEIGKQNPDYNLNIDESLNDPNSPTSDSWAFKQFNVPALTYEVGDETDRELIKRIARSAARSLMKLMLENKI